MKTFKRNIRNPLTLLASLVFITALNPLTASAQKPGIFLNDDDIDAEIEPRLKRNEADFAMTTREGSVDMLLARDMIYIQFTDKFLEEIDKEIKDEEEYDEASVLADVLTSMISSGVRTLLDRSLAIPILEIGEVFYEDGRLYIIDHEGEDIFGELEINDVYIMEDFSRRDALRFVEKVERRMI